MITGCYAQMAPQSILDTYGPASVPCRQRQQAPGGRLGPGRGQLRPGRCCWTISAEKGRSPRCRSPAFRTAPGPFSASRTAATTSAPTASFPTPGAAAGACPWPRCWSRQQSLPGQGYREIVITGINVGKYGLDLTEGENLVSLLTRLCCDFSGIRFRLSSVEPTEVDDPLLTLLADRTNFMPHLHIPLQSGDDTILPTNEPPLPRRRLCPGGRPGPPGRARCRHWLRHPQRLSRRDGPGPRQHRTVSSRSCR